MDGEIRWERVFPYGRRGVRVARLRRGWLIGVDGREARAATLVEAFEALLRRRSGDDEIRVVVDALAEDRGRR